MVTRFRQITLCPDLGEVRLGIERLRRKDGAQADLLEQWLHGLQATYRDHIINVNGAFTASASRLGDGSSATNRRRWRGRFRSGEARMPGRHSHSARMSQGEHATPGAAAQPPAHRPA